MLATAFAYDFHGDCLLSPTDMLLLIGNKRTTSTIVLPDFYQFFPPFFPNNTAVAESFSLSSSMLSILISGENPISEGLIFCCV